ncbi:MAG TPA: YggS family pyridoxal phosphate-dependent enzyme [Lacipirellulaceae bacterium]|nr:YggS family pyridoxal phosphate-dependent enzyme [Lacipirellulaceae bacterium]
MSIPDNLRRLRERIARSAETAGRKADEITLVGVTKYVGAQQAAELAAAGCTDLGESRPQELWHKAGEVASATRSFTPRPMIRWHLIGHLQRNKVARTLPLVSLIHSVDSQRLLAAINDAASTLPLPSGEVRGEGALENSSRAHVLLEVNTSAESAKHGLRPADVEPLLALAPNYPHVAIRGLMTIAALEGGPPVAARNFASLRDLRDRLKPNTPPCVQLWELSMGMSADVEIAIREGSTIVRVGSALWDV